MATVAAASAGSSSLVSKLVVAAGFFGASFAVRQFVFGRTLKSQDPLNAYNRAAPVSTSATTPTPLPARTFDTVMPVLPSTDLNRTLAFYSKLGFTAAYPLTPEGSATFSYLIMHMPEQHPPTAAAAATDSKDAKVGPTRSVEIHFRITTGDVPDFEPANNNTSVYIRLHSCVDEWAERLCGASAIPHSQPWGMREWWIRDPDRNLITFGAPVTAPKRTTG